VPTEAVGSLGAGFTECFAILPTSMKHVGLSAEKQKKGKNYGGYNVTTFDI